MKIRPKARGFNQTFSKGYSGGTDQEKKSTEGKASNMILEGKYPNISCFTVVS